MEPEPLKLIFKLFYSIPPDGGIAMHTHNDGIELIGEVGN